jgi:hypothetical protein
MTVFLSYSAPAARIAKNLSASLGERGVRVLDSQDIPPGSGIVSTIEQRMRESDAILLLIDKSQPAAHQQTEWIAALERSWQEADRKLIPILLDDAVLPKFLQSRIHVCAASQDAKWGAIADQIVDSLKGKRKLGLISESRRARLVRERERRFREMAAEVKALREAI